MRPRGPTLERFEDDVRDFAVSRHLFDGCERVVAGVSGGPDSMAMMYALLRIRAVNPSWPRVVVAHLDHALRGDGSTADAEFVQRAAEASGLECVVRRIDVAAEAAARSANLEAVARDIRYGFLEEVALARGAAAVATAHTASDQAETVLMRLARGAGLDGMAGISVSRPLSDGPVRLVRPLLGVTRRDVLAYCRDRGIPYRTDPSNDDVHRTRAAIRQTVMPELERLSPGAGANLSRAAALAADDRELLDELADDAFRKCADAAPDGVALDLAALGALAKPLQRRVLREAMRHAKGDLKRITFDHVDALVALSGPGRTGRELSLPGGLTARRTARHLIVCHTVEK